MVSWNRRMLSFLGGSALFGAGITVGCLVTGHTSAVNKFGQPKTVIHIVAYKFKPTTSQYEQDQAIAGIKAMAGQIPGIKNIWLKTERNQIRDFDGVYVIEFATAEAAADYAESPLHDTWRKKWEELRANSLSFQVSNP